jgi:hypothetical protein
MELLEEDSDDEIIAPPGVIDLVEEEYTRTIWEDDKVSKITDVQGKKR